MSRDPKYDILFEPVKIGPVTAPNRFYQVPHCNSLGHGRPRAEAANRAVKAEGGWGVVCTQEVEIHPSAETTPSIEGRIWDGRDIPQHRLMTDAVHEHGALAGIELVYNGSHVPNLYSRIAPMSASATVVHGVYVDGIYIAWTEQLLKAEGPVTQEVNDRNLVISYHEDSSVSVQDAVSGKSYTPVRAFWFAWYAFHPDTMLRAQRKK